MTPEDAITRISHSTARAGFDTSDRFFFGMRVLVARTSRFRLRWIASKLHTFLLATAFPSGMATPDQLDGFMRAGMEYAKANKGGLPVGMQTGVAAVTIAVTEYADDQACTWAANAHGRKFGVLPYPVLLDVGTGEVTYPSRMLIGSLFSSYLQGLVDKHVIAAVGGRASSVTRS